MNTVDSSRRTIEGKDYVLQSLNKELERIQDEFRKENEKCKEEYMVVRKKDEKIIERVKDELKHRLEVLDIPPLNNFITKEERLMVEVNKKNIIIEIKKADFQNSLAEDYNKHQLEINEYRKK